MNHITSTFRVLYDKIYQYGMYTISDNDESLEDAVHSLDDYFYNNKYQHDEDKDMDRLYENNIINEYKVALSEPTHIIDNIYLGSSFNAGNYNTLKNMNITTIINVTIMYTHTPQLDDNKSSIIKYLNEAYDIIKDSQVKNNGNILIHCFMGKSRSLAIVLYYVLKTHKKDNGDMMTFDEALQFIKEKRTTVNPTHRIAKDIIKNTIDCNKKDNNTSVIEILGDDVNFI